MALRIGVVGFGEAGSAFFGRDGVRGAEILAYDRKTDAASTAAAKRGEYAAQGVAGCAVLAEALGDVAAAASLVTADQSLAAAQAAAPLLPSGALWLDMNSVSPATKRAAAETVGAGRGRYVDVAVMAPVHPARIAVPLLLSGPDAEAGASLLTAIGFSNVRVVNGEVGAASAIKMIRSIMVKGLEALTAECFLAARTAGVLDEVVTSLDAAPERASWKTRAAYNLERMTTHGLRRAAEMQEVVATLDELAIGSGMSRSAVQWQRSLGELCLPPDEAAALEGQLDGLLAALGRGPQARRAGAPLRTIAVEAERFNPSVSPI